jgi:hypothetical protein
MLINAANTRLFFVGLIAENNSTFERKVVPRRVLVLTPLDVKLAVESVATVGVFDVATVITLRQRRVRMFGGQT